MTDPRDTVAGSSAGPLEQARRAVLAAPDDANLHMRLGIALDAVGDATAAADAFRRACELAPRSVTAWYNLAESLREQARTGEAIAALERALDIDPASPLARISMARAQASVGRIDEAAAGLHALTREDAANADAWWQLADLKTVPFSAEDVARLERALASPGLPLRACILLRFTLGHALEDQGDHSRALDVLSQANALQRREVTWNGGVERKRIDAIINIFSQPTETTQDSEAGRGILFIASLPRSGSTLVEQVLASHPAVEGAGEITDLKDLITGEALAHRRPFPLWIPGATARDWGRLGAAYLERTSRWREHKPCLVDKNLLNWMFVGAALAMLPAARIILVRRDPVETCLACYREYFAAGSQFTCNLDEMADRYADFWRLSRFWLPRFPGRVLDLEYEALVAQPEATIRSLLDFCALPFDPACLEFHRTRRVVLSSPSAAQVRRPVQHTTARASNYGARLDPLRQRLRAGGVPVAPDGP